MRARVVKHFRTETSIASHFKNEKMSEIITFHLIFDFRPLCPVPFAFVSLTCEFGVGVCFHYGFHGAFTRFVSVCVSLCSVYSASKESEKRSLRKNVIDCVFAIYCYYILLLFFLACIHTFPFSLDTSMSGIIFISDYWIEQLLR